MCNFLGVYRARRIISYHLKLRNIRRHGHPLDLCTVTRPIIHYVCSPRTRYENKEAR